MNLERGIFQCFGCKARGNVLEFAALMEGVDPADGNALRKVAVKLQEAFFPEGASTRTKTVAPAKKEVAKPKESPLQVNAPLDFELKGLEANHPCLIGQGLTLATLNYFGVGFCSRGLLKDRIAIPLHDEEGRLIGYAGRVVDDRDVSEETPTYLFPAKRERNGTVFNFDRSRFLYNGSRIKAPCDDLVIVQEFPAVWWLNQCGFPNAVAVMGDESSERQIELIIDSVKSSGRVWMLCDGDESGERLAQSLLIQISLHRSVRLVKLARGGQPTDLSEEELKIWFTT